MTNLAKKILKYRLDHELSIEEMANKLEVEPSKLDDLEKDRVVPDANDLIKISKLLNEPIDSLLNEKEKVEAEVVEGQVIDDDGDKIFINKDTVKFVDKNGDHVEIDRDGIHSSFEHRNKELIVTETISGVYSILVLVAYILMGAIGKMWHPGWVIFLTIPLMESLSRCIRKRNAIYLNFPILATIIFLLVGFYANLWHPMWVVFLFIPVYYQIVHSINNYVRRHK